jgi:hypothetical protein
MGEGSGREGREGREGKGKGREDPQPSSNTPPVSKSCINLLLLTMQWGQVAPVRLTPSWPRCDDPNKKISQNELIKLTLDYDYGHLSRQNDTPNYIR